MFRYQNIISPLIVTASLGVLNCTPPIQQDHAPTYTKQFSGTVVDESLERKFIGEDIYTFSLKTEQGLKVFRCYKKSFSTDNCPYPPHTLNALISPGTNLTVNFPYSREADSLEFQLEDKDTLEIDGELIAP